MPDTSMISGRYGRRRLALFVLVVVAIVLAVASGPLPAFATSAKSSTTYFPPTGFGGYRWIGTVKQLSAQWSVPTVQPSSKFEFASTWVGAQNQNGGGPFIQLGITENSLGSLGTQYRSFWSDPKVGFHPQVLSVVHAGDLVSANMSQVPDGWVLTFKDITRDSVKTKKVVYGVGAKFTQAEWLQEDPAPNSDTPNDLTYPTTSLVQIAHLLVNHSAPKLNTANGQVLIASNHITLVPSAVTDDAFRLLAPTGEAKAYLDIARSLDLAISVFDASSTHWTALSIARRRSVVKELARKFQLNATALDALPLPDHDATRLGDRSVAIAHDLSAWTAAGLVKHGATYSRLVHDEYIAPLADRVRADLGLPPS